MRPELDALCLGLAGTIMTRIIANPSAPYAMGNLAVIALTLGCAAQEAERAADVRFQENKVLRSLFNEAMTEVGDEKLAARLKQAAALEDSSIRISALNKTNDELLRTLIELQAWAEQTPQCRSEGHREEMYGLPSQGRLRRVQSQCPRSSDHDQ